VHMHVHMHGGTFFWGLDIVDAGRFGGRDSRSRRVECRCLCWWEPSPIAVPVPPSNFTRLHVHLQLQVFACTCIADLHPPYWDRHTAVSHVTVLTHSLTLGDGGELCCRARGWVERRRHRVDAGGCRCISTWPADT
jgi:hypothetical protein